MKINEFLNNVNGKTAEEIESMVIVRKYIPIQEKRMIARDILDRCMNDINGFVVIDNVDKSIYFTINSIAAYTNIEFSEDYEDAIEEYDILVDSYWVKNFNDFIGADIDILWNVLLDEEKMLLTGNSIEAQVAKVANSLVNAVDVISDKINNSIGDFNMNQLIPEGTDVNKLMDMLKKLN